MGGEFWVKGGDISVYIYMYLSKLGVGVIPNNLR